MAYCTVVGSGPSGVHFALAALARGHSVEMIDVGHAAPPAVNPQDSMAGLKSALDDPAGYFLGADFEGVLLPGRQEEFYGIPPGKAYAMQQVPGLEVRAEQFAPMFSFARGGLAELWTGGCYPLNDAELEAFPFGYAQLEPYYTAVARRIGINGVADDLAQFMPLHDGLQAPLRLDRHADRLLARYSAQREYLQQRLGCYMGRARQAVLSAPLGERPACNYLGRCIWGCPTGALYTPSLSLTECLKSANFTYRDDLLVTRFGIAENGRVSHVCCESVSGAAPRTLKVERLVLAAGALGSTRILLDSVYRHNGTVLRLPGLMDNRQVLVPFINLRMTGRHWQPDSYQYNQLAMGLVNGNAQQYVHCLITTLKTALLHPIVAQMPVDLRTALYLFRNLHAALGVVNVNFHDTRRADCYVTLDVDDPARPALRLHYTPPADEAPRIQSVLRRLKRALWKLGCVVPPGMAHLRPMGASVHYAGTLPMSAQARPWTVTPDCRSHDFDNLYLADGATFPALPAKNITFSLMANAVRVADTI